MVLPNERSNKSKQFLTNCNKDSNGNREAKEAHGVEVLV